MSLRGVDLAGKRFGRWLVVHKGEQRSSRTAWYCVCECGNTGTIISRNLVKGLSKSCGCLTTQTLTKHGHNKKSGVSGEYNSWHHMKQRCENPHNDRYEDYGGRGITVCDRWMLFENFLKDMGAKPTKDHSIDRIDVNGNYEPSNCKWSNRKEQQRNIRVQKNNKTGVKGVCFDSSRDKFVAQMYCDGKRVLMKRFDTLEEAKEARKQAELKYWGKSSL